MGKRTSYQDRAIKNYYQNRESIAIQRLQELVTELYLAEGKKRKRYWENVATHLKALEVKQSQIDHLLAEDKPELVANLVKKLTG